MIVGSDEYDDFTMFVVWLGEALGGVVGLVGDTHIIVLLWIARRFIMRSSIKRVSTQQGEMVSCHDISKW